MRDLCGHDSNEGEGFNSPCLLAKLRRESMKVDEGAQELLLSVFFPRSLTSFSISVTLSELGPHLPLMSAIVKGNCDNHFSFLS